MTSLSVYKNSLISPNGSWKPEAKGYTCNHCLRRFDNDGSSESEYRPPVPIPTNYDGKLYSVMGTFCSWSCGKAFMRGRNGFNNTNSMMWLATMAKQVFGYQGFTIECAPDQIWLPTFRPDDDPNAITWDAFDKACSINQPCETMENTLIPACVIETSSLLLVQGKPSVAMRDVLATRNNEKEVTMTGNGSGESSSSSSAGTKGSQSQATVPEKESMYGSFLERMGDTAQPPVAAPSSSSSRSKKQSDDEKPPAKKKSRSSSLLAFMKK